jgi:hypothetical protein
MLNRDLVRKTSSIEVFRCRPDGRRPPWCRDKWYGSCETKYNLEKELVDFGVWVQMTPAQIYRRSLVIQIFKSVCKKKFPTGWRIDALVQRQHKRACMVLILIYA